MKVLLLLLLAGLAAGGRLENTYLPPTGAAQAGGQDLPLPVPQSTEAFLAPTNTYLPPSAAVVTEARLQQPPKPLGNVGIVRQQGLQSTLGLGAPAPLQQTAVFLPAQQATKTFAFGSQQTGSLFAPQQQQQTFAAKTSPFGSQQSFVPKTTSFGSQQSFLSKSSSFGSQQQAFSQPTSTFNAQSSASVFGGLGARQSVGFSSSAPSGQAVAILRSSNVNNGDGRYAYSYATENGIEAQEQGELRQDGAEGVNTVQGGFAFTAPDTGARLALTYTADENGFRAFGEHLPTPPPIPEAILRSIELNAREEQAQQGYQQQAAYKTSIGQQGYQPQQGYQQQAAYKTSSSQQGYQQFTQQSPRPFQQQPSQPLKSSFQPFGFQQQQGNQFVSQRQGYQQSAFQQGSQPLFNQGQQAGSQEGYRY